MVKCVSYNCNSIRNNIETVKSLFTKSDIIFLQELMLSKSDLPMLNDINDQFQHIAYVKDRESEGINEGRPSKGVAIFWKNNLSSRISPVLVSDSCIGIILTHGSNKMLMLNVYMPCDLQTFNALDEYRSMLANLEILIREQNVNEVILAGDFNADPFKSRFWTELLSFKKSLSLVLMDEQLPRDSFTYLCPARNSTSWLDHILCTENVAHIVTGVFIDYDSAIYDHFCIYFDLKLNDIQSEHVIDTGEFIEKMVNWNKITEDNKIHIKIIMKEMIESQGLLCYEVFNCKNVNCRDATHLRLIDKLFEKAKTILMCSTNEFSFVKTSTFRIIPGWNDFVKELYREARRHFQEWKRKGKPPEGVYLENMKISRSKFKTALQKCKENEELIRREKLLNNLENNNHKSFWNEVYKVKKHNDVTATSIDGYTDPKEICNMFSEKFKNIFAMKGKQHVEGNMRVVQTEVQNVNVSFSNSDVQEGIRSLKCSIGVDGIHSNHLKYCDELFSELLSLLFESFIIHQYAPKNLINGMITPTVKDRFGDLKNSSNYRPIMSSSVILKLFEYCLLKKINPYIELSDSQHGFRSGHSTATACAVLKETILNYRNSNSDVYACFIDISKAFDNVDHGILMNKILTCGVPAIYVNIIKYWYSNQLVHVRHSSCNSEEWSIRNGVRQGGVLSGLFFGLYIDSLLDKVSACKYGCKLGIFKSNILAYADDLVLLAPSAMSLQILINEAMKEAANLELKFNKDKSKWIIFCAAKNKHEEVRDMQIDNEPIERVMVFRYLGYVIRYDLVNTDDIQRAMKKFYCEFNVILRKFSFADVRVKLFLFRYYCLQIYGSDLWLESKGAINVLKQFAVGYHKAIKKILGLSSHESNHFACQEAQLLTFKHLLNKMKVMTVFRLFQSPCNYIAKNLPFLRISSVFCTEIRDLFHKEYGIEDVLDNDRDAVNARIVYVQNHEETMR